MEERREGRRTGRTTERSSDDIRSDNGSGNDLRSSGDVGNGLEMDGRETSSTKEGRTMRKGTQFVMQEVNDVEDIIVLAQVSEKYGAHYFIAGGVEWTSEIRGAMTFETADAAKQYRRNNISWISEREYGADKFKAVRLSIYLKRGIEGMVL